jgi:hypothetical protein
LGRLPKIRSRQARNFVPSPKPRRSNLRCRAVGVVGANSRKGTIAASEKANTVAPAPGTMIKSRICPMVTIARRRSRAKAQLNLAPDRSLAVGPEEVVQLVDAS